VERHRESVATVSDDEVYRKYSDDLVRFATGLVGPADAADVVSDAVARVLASPKWPDARDRRAYLFGSVLNEARMHHRSTMRRRAREARVAQREGLVDPEVRPEVLEAVARLSVRQRAVVVLTYWHDLHERETAELLGISVGTVRRHLARAHDRLRGVIHDD
jgi:RNA polymerase sigma factor (sigma-70 family)